MTTVEITEPISKCMVGTLIFIFVLIVVLTISCIFYSCYLQNNPYDGMNQSLYGTAMELPLVKNPGNSKIAVFMVATPEIDNYSQYTIDQNRKWAKSHGYDFFVYTEKLLKDLPINFSKIQYSLDLLSKGSYDYVMYIDADAIVHRMDYDIRHLIGRYMVGAKSVMFGEDCYSGRDCSKPGRVNSGVFIVRNNDLGRRVMEKWRDASRGVCSKYVNVFPNCQLVFSNCVYPYLFFAISIIPFNLINGFGDTLLIKHAMAMDDIRRVDEIKKEYRNNDSTRIPVF